MVQSECWYLILAKASFFCLYKDVEIAIKTLKIRHSIFVIKTKNQDLVLEQIFLNFIKFIQKYRFNQIFGTITNFYIY